MRRRAAPVRARPHAEEQLCLAERGGWGAVPARSRAANQWTAAMLAERRDEARVKPCRGDAAGMPSG